MSPVPQTPDGARDRIQDIYEAALDADGFVPEDDLTWLCDLASSLLVGPPIPSAGEAT